MKIREQLTKLAGEALTFLRAGDEKLASRRFRRELPELQLQSPWFEHGGRLPARASADGEGEPPPLTWSEPPPETRELVLIVEDPDAPMPVPFVHWLVYDIHAQERALDATRAAHAREGQNSLLRPGFTPPAPPPHHGVHHYYFQLFALDRPLALEKGVGRSMLLSQMEGHVIAMGEIVGTYER